MRGSWALGLRPSLPLKLGRLLSTDPAASSLIPKDSAQRETMKLAGGPDGRLEPSFCSLEVPLGTPSPSRGSLALPPGCTGLG